MKAHFSYIIAIILLFSSCKTETTSNDKMEVWKAEVRAAEKAFNDMAQKEGLTKAFEYFAAEDGVIRRSKKIIKGKSAIAEWYKNDVQPGDNLTWTPTFVDVSNSGDMAFTYGDFVFTYLDSLGNKKENKGIFHTVWKRQKDGSWKYAWD
jgi:ketosteroid isomerase-like protein